MWALRFIPRAPLGFGPMTCVRMAIKYRFWGADHGAQGYWLGRVLICVMRFSFYFLFFFSVIVFLSRSLIDWGWFFLIRLLFYSFLAP
ncbi:hypothetical protein BDV40DRAFT_105786 [Aspergillus tamarii]|uniref:Uncharacterized protein n=1 Tax=Aspergillus tamarii TaxID=41984 RepID=A0A5N6UB15_ASPTM|nr:hypothetical protein BDV40DRAFT_105786 [Aspergillus tamarii]